MSPTLSPPPPSLSYPPPFPSCPSSTGDMGKLYVDIIFLVEERMLGLVADCSCGGACCGLCHVSLFGAWRYY